jgi:outer membrane protein assembly factor BamB
LIDDFGVEKPDWGFAGSPLIEGDRMFLNAGGHGMALNKHTGDLVWLSNTNRGGYSSVVSFDLNGTNAAAFLSYNSAVCVDLADGRLIWSNFWQTPLIVNIPDPIVAGDRIFLTGYKKSARIVRAGDGLDLTGAITVQTHMSPGVVISNHLFAFHGDVAESTGALKCVDLQTGVIRWSTNFGITAGTVGALMAADNKLIVITGGRENSPVQIFLAYASTNSFPVISQFSPLNFSPFCWTPPALVGDRLYVRSGNGAVRAFLLPVDALPRLGIGPRPGVVDLTWPTNATGFTLEKRPLPAGGPDWSGVTNPAVNDAGRFRVTLPATNGQEYFRLRKPM